MAAVARNAAVIAAVTGVDQGAGAVQSIPVGDAERALRIAGELEQAGVLAGCFRPPAVPDGISRIRLTARADLTADQTQRAATLVAEMTAQP